MTMPLKPKRRNPPDKTKRNLVALEKRVKRTIAKLDTRLKRVEVRVHAFDEEARLLREGRREWLRSH